MQQIRGPVDTGPRCSLESFLRQTDRSIESMTKSELIEILAQRQGHLKADDVDLSVKTLLEMMSDALSHGDRIEIRGFGSFSLHFRPARIGRNPKTGDSVSLTGKHVPHFKPGKELRERVNLSLQTPR
jgi:integration host factor subunit beta